MQESRGFMNETLASLFDQWSLRIIYYTSTDSLPPDVTQNTFTRTDVVVSSVLCLLYLLTVVNCVMVTATVLARPSMHRSMNIYVVSLCFSDVILTSSIVPINVISFFVALPPQVGCDFQRAALVADVAVFGGIYSVVAIAVDRHRAIGRPLSLGLGPRRSVLHVALIWSASVVFTLPICLSATLREPSLDGVPACNLVDEAALAISLSNTVLIYLLPLCVICVLYHRTIRVLRDCERDLPHMHVVNRKRRRAVQMIVVITSVFAICWFPFHLLGIFSRKLVSTAFPDAEEVANYLRYVSLVAVLLNAWLNALVYGYYSESFRRALFGMAWLSCCCPRLKGIHAKRWKDKGPMPQPRPGSLTSNGNTNASRISSARSSKMASGLTF